MIITECSFVCGYWHVCVGDNRSFHHLVGRCGRMNCVSGLADNSVESTVMVGGVLNGARGAIWFNQAVVPLNFVTNSLLGLLLDVVGVVILNSIAELVVSWSLGKTFTWM
jgi:hypothetical protein